MGIVTFYKSFMFDFLISKLSNSGRPITVTQETTAITIITIIPGYFTFQSNVIVYTYYQLLFFV